MAYYVRDVVWIGQKFHDTLVDYGQGGVIEVAETHGLFFLESDLGNSTCVHGDLIVGDLILVVGCLWPW